MRSVFTKRVSYATFDVIAESTRGPRARQRLSGGAKTVSHSSEATVRIGAVDIGTNSVRLLVADVDERERLRTAHRMGEISRLGEGLDRTGSIDEAAAARTLECLERFVHEAEYSGASRIRVAGTNAFRVAANGQEIACRFSDRVGYPVEVLTGEEEARLVFLAVLSGLAPQTGCSIVVDIGGGSTEVISGEGETGTHVISLELGCVRLTERLIRDDPPIDDELGAVRAHVQEVFREKLGSFDPGTLARAIGVGGTVTAFGALDLSLVKYDPSRIENHYLTRSRIESISKHLCSIPLAQRRDLAGVSRGRADIIPAGAIILSEFAGRFDLPGIFVSTRGLRYGLVLSEARRNFRGAGTDQAART
jgi:exopolyphosphatase / guanosine-5'-triphosphate,3'-diphosphate pyrophosphatase